MLALGDGPVEVMTNGGEAERAICFCGSRIELDGFRGVLFSGGGSLGERTNAEDAEPVVVIGDARVSEGVIRVCLDGFLVRLERLCQTDFGVGAPVVATAQVGYESFGTVSAAFR
jgi:hypothetical protein